MVTFDGQVKVLDFGIAKSVESTLETKTGILKGRVAYMAPEQAWGQPVDRRADVYAAGVMIWEAVAGQRLWAGKNDVEILARHLREGAPPLRSVVPGVAPDLDALCARAMSRDAADRPPSAAALLDELESHLAGRADAMSMRDVGSLVSAVFAEERRRMSGIIEEKLHRVRSSPSSGVMPTLEGRIRGTPSGRLLAFNDPGESALVSLGPAQILRGLQASVPVPAAPAADDGTPWWRTRRATLGGIAAGLLTLTLGLVAALGHGDSPAPALAPASSTLVPAAAPALPDMLDLLVRVSPPGAQITLDGVPLGKNPYRGRLARDGQMHHVGATAEGYDGKLEDVTFAGDLSIDLSLDRHPAPIVHGYAPLPAHSARHPDSAPAASAHAADPAPAPPPPPPAAAHADVGPAGGHAPLRPISRSNPYGTP
jgi:serine/threonine-protein kinase